MEVHCQIVCGKLNKCWGIVFRDFFFFKFISWVNHLVLLLGMIVTDER